MSTQDASLPVYEQEAERFVKNSQSISRLQRDYETAHQHLEAIMREMAQATRSLNETNTRVTEFAEWAWSLGEDSNQTLDLIRSLDPEQIRRELKDLNNALNEHMNRAAVRLNTIDEFSSKSTDLITTFERKAITQHALIISGNENLAARIEVLEESLARQLQQVHAELVSRLGTQLLLVNNQLKEVDQFQHSMVQELARSIDTRVLPIEHGLGDIQKQLAHLAVATTTESDRVIARQSEVAKDIQVGARNEIAGIARQFLQPTLENSNHNRVALVRLEESLVKQQRTLSDNMDTAMKRLRFDLVFLGLMVGLVVVTVGFLAFGILPITK